MESRKTNLTIEDFEDKKFGEGKTAGRYTRFKTDQGWLSCFDKITIEKLKDNEGKYICVEIQTDKNDKEKISKFIGIAEDETSNVKTEKVISESERKSVKGSPYEKDPVGLAVDIFIKLMDGAKFTEEKATKAGLEIIMQTSIELVKIAQKSF